MIEEYVEISNCNSQKRLANLQIDYVFRYYIDD